MAGGTFTAYNKVLPGVYINVVSRETLTINVGERGTVAMGRSLSWGPLGQVMEIALGEDITPFIGYDLTNANAIFVREMTKGSDVTSGPNKLLLYRLPGSGGAKASATIGDLTATAKYEGTRGNDITIVIASDPDVLGIHIVDTVVDGSIVDSQRVQHTTDLVNNNWVDFTNTAATITDTAGTDLAGGTDPTPVAADYAAFLTAIEPFDFDILAYDGTDATTITAISLFMTRLNEQIGRKCQAVVSGASGLNSKYMIVNNNGVTLNDGTNLAANEAVWWLAGAEAGAKYNQSLTYAQYPQAKAAYPKLTDAQTQEAIEAGQLCFIDNFGVVKVCTDINSKTTVTPKEGAEFKKNRAMRVINQFCNDAYENFSNNFIGKVDNNDAGRALIRAWIIGYLNDMQAGNGIQNFTAEDVTVIAGPDIDSIIVNVAIQLVDSVEKIYCTVTVSATAVTIATA